MRGHCECPEPLESVDDRKAGSCIKCGRLIGPADTLSTDQTLGAFLGRLADAFPGKPSPSFVAFEKMIAAREHAGREQFGFKYLARQNCQEAIEELLDLVVYMHLDLLQARRNGVDEDWATALEASYHAFRAFESVQQREARRRGTP